MSKNMGRQTRLPSYDQVDEMKKDLNFKKKQLNDAERTAGNLQVEVENRKADLIKMTTLGDRIQNEMNQVAEGCDKMEDEMANKFTKIEDLTAQFEQEKERLSEIKRLVSQYKT